jgi:hypothetical protein
MVEPRIRELIGAQQAQILARLQEARAKFEQGGNICDGLEAAFREFIDGHLPRRLSVGHGEVVDGSGRRSGQTDVLILDEDHPFRLDPAEPGLALIEGVAAAGELKACLTSDALEKVIAASARFKALEAEEPDGAVIYAAPSDKPRFYEHRPYFAIAAESELKLETVGERLAKADVKTEGQILDAIYCLDRGWVINCGDGRGAFQFRSPDGTSHPGWVIREIPPEEVLFDFFVWLSIVMPRVFRAASPFLRYL